MINWTLELISIKKLINNPKNPRYISKDQMAHLEALVEKYGLIDRPIVNTDMTVIGGHQRIKVLKKMKVKEVQCWVPDHALTQEEVDHLCIGLNLNQGQWDFDILANQFELNDLLSWGFNEEQLLGEAADAQQINKELEDDGEILEPGKDEDATTKLGDVYQLGQHRLVCGDSTDPDIVTKCLDGNTPIVMITDPPYGVSYDASWRGEACKDSAKRAKGKVQNDDQVNWALAWHLFPGAVAYIWHAGKYCSEVQKSLEEAEFQVVSQIIWIKQHFALSRGDYHWQHEPCWYAVKKGCEHNWQGSRKESTTWEIPNLNCFGKSKDDERTAHSTQKPLECMARPIRNNTSIGEGVYDPFLGSGTTMIAADRLDRICHGIELSPAYCDIIVQRWIDDRKKRGLSSDVIKNYEKYEE